MNIYVGNLNYNLEEDQLRSAFQAYGEVSSVKIIIDRETGRSKGFGFVEMTDNEAGSKAIAELNDSDLDGRNLRVSEARAN